VSNADLIEEARKTARLYRSVGHNHGIERTLDRLAEALEIADQSRVVDRDTIGDLPQGSAILVRDKNIGDWSLWEKFGDTYPLHEYGEIVDLFDENGEPAATAWVSRSSNSEHSDDYILELTDAPIKLLYRPGDSRG